MKSSQLITVVVAFAFTIPARSDHIHVRAVTDGDLTSVEAGPNDEVMVYLQLKLDDGAGEEGTSGGLAGFALNLSAYYNYSTFDLCDTSGFWLGSQVPSFDRNHGVTNPPGLGQGSHTGFSGTCDGNFGLYAIGGAQNTIANSSPPGPAFPVGDVVTGLATNGWLTVAKGTLTLPGWVEDGAEIVLNPAVIWATTLDDAQQTGPYDVSSVEGTDAAPTALTIEIDAAPPEIVGGFSSKNHFTIGELAIAVWDGASEPRINGPTTLSVEFNEQITRDGGLDDVDLSSGTATDVAISLNGSEITVKLHGAKDEGVLEVGFPGVMDKHGNVITDTLCVRVLLGDADGNFSVNYVDEVRTQARIGYSVGSTTFRFDMNTNGAIASPDVAITTANDGHSVGTCP